MNRNCIICDQVYQAEARYVNRGQGLTCSRACGTILSSRKRSVNPEPNVTCSWCKTDFYRQPSHLQGSKSGLFFCCREHKDSAQKLGGMKEIMPPHYGTANVPEYRRKAFSFYPNKCRVCDWNEYPDILQVNHIDLNRSNNAIENLEILCPTHHDVFHYLDGSGRFAWKGHK